MDKMTPEQQQFVADLFEEAKTHEQFLTFVRFGLGTLLDSQAVLVRLVTIEAKRQAERHGPTASIADEAVKIFAELGLHLSVPA